MTEIEGFRIFNTTRLRMARLALSGYHSFDGDEAASIEKTMLLLREMEDKSINSVSFESNNHGE